MNAAIHATWRPVGVGGGRHRKWRVLVRPCRSRAWEWAGHPPRCHMRRRPLTDKRRHGHLHERGVAIRDMGVLLRVKRHTKPDNARLAAALSARWGCCVDVGCAPRRWVRTSALGARQGRWCVWWGSVGSVGGRCSCGGGACAVCRAPACAEWRRVQSGPKDPCRGLPRAGW